MLLEELLEGVVDHVTGHEHEAAGGFRIVFGDALVELRPAEAGHAPVANEQFVFLLGDLIEGRSTVLDRVHLEAVLLEDLANQFENPFFVINHEHAFTITFEEAGRGSALIGRVRHTVLGRDFDNEGGAFAGKSVRGNGAAMFADDAIAEAEAETGAFAGGLGGEKRVEHFVKMILWDAGAVIFDGDANVGGSAFGNNADQAVTFDVFECLAGVVEDIQNDLLELVAIAKDSGQGGIEMALHLDVTGAQFVAENFKHATDHFVHVE